MWNSQVSADMAFASLCCVAEGLKTVWLGAVLGGRPDRTIHIFLECFIYSLIQNAECRPTLVGRGLAPACFQILLSVPSSDLNSQGGFSH